MADKKVQIETDPTYDIWLSTNNHKVGFHLPVLPEKITIKRKSTGKTYDMIGTGQINQIGAPDLVEVSFDSYFPCDFAVANYAVSNENETDDSTNKSSQAVAKKVTPPPNPQLYVNLLSAWMASKRPIRFIYQGGNKSFTLPMSIDSFDYWEQGGDVGDIFYSISFKQYVFYSAKRVTVVTKQGKTVVQKQEPSRLNEQVQPETYTLKPGDSLFKVAKKILGNSSRWGEIQKLNRITDAQIKKLPVGKVLKLPKG